MDTGGDLRLCDGYAEDGGLNTPAAARGVADVGGGETTPRRATVADAAIALLLL